MTRIEELLKQIEKEGILDYGYTQAEQDFYDLMQTLVLNDYNAYVKYITKYNSIRNEKLKELE